MLCLITAILMEVKHRSFKKIFLKKIKERYIFLTTAAAIEMVK